MPDIGHLLEHLNPPQQQAVTHGEGPLLVLAGPGSGKTTVIIKRIQYLIYHLCIPPEQILVITFTKDAAKSMQQRFLRQTDSVLAVNFGTFHSVFYQMLLQSPGSFFHTSRKPRILTESQKKEIIFPLLKKYGEQYATKEELASEVSEILSAISYYKNTSNMQSAVKNLSEERQGRFEELFSEYQQCIRQQNALDFDDMVYECREMLTKNREIRAYWQNRFSHILMDEFQDINPLQYQVVKQLTKPPYNLFAVGDDDQSIYGFRGSDPVCLKQFEQELHASQVILNLNYRSRPDIVKASLKVIGENKQRFTKQLRAAGQVQDCTEENKESCQTSREAVRILSFTEREQQTAYLKEEAERFIKEHPDKSCAVLFRTNTFMQGFAGCLKQEGIPFSMQEKGKNLYEHFIVRDVMAYLQFAAGDTRRSIFLQLMNKPVRYLRRDALAETERVDLERLKNWYQMHANSHKEDYIRALARLQSQLATLHRMPPGLAVSYVCKAVGYEEYLRTLAGKKRAEKLQEWLEILDWLKEDARKQESLKDWLELQNNYEVPPVQKSGEGVQLMTIHASKGLEFDRVWIPDCNEKNIPHGKMPDQAAVEEERRIFYVGMTRAKENLELLCLTGTSERPRLPSRFLNPIMGDYSSKSSSNSQLSRYSSNASATRSYSASSSI